MSCAKTAELIEVFFGSGLVWGLDPPGQWLQGG